MRKSCSRSSDAIDGGELLLARTFASTSCSFLGQVTTHNHGVFLRKTCSYQCLCSSKGSSVCLLLHGQSSSCLLGNVHCKLCLLLCCLACPMCKGRSNSSNAIDCGKLFFTQTFAVLCCFFLGQVASKDCSSFRQISNCKDFSDRNGSSICLLRRRFNSFCSKLSSHVSLILHGLVCIPCQICSCSGNCIQLLEALFTRCLPCGCSCFLG
mmetsp:Transcript_96415/g.171398  ORF Transcript_96415/g.171398 Transcript_96415/m.171398 type:complete len:210 (+) Transcript_96415:1412-2041(+)